MVSHLTINIIPYLTVPLSTSAAENDKKHDDLSEWDPWVLYPWLTKN